MGVFLVFIRYFPANPQGLRIALTCKWSETIGWGGACEGLCYSKINKIVMNTSTTQTAACEKCVYWKATAESTGECRRNAPQSVVFAVDEATRFETRFPVTSSDDWCGEFQAK